MTDPRKNYGLPRRPPLPFRQLMVILTLHVVLIVLWLLLPSSPLTVALLAITVLSVVFIGVGTVLRSRELDEKPGRKPVTPPSVDRG